MSKIKMSNSLKQMPKWAIFLWLLSVLCVFLVFKASDEPAIRLIEGTSIETLFIRFATGNSILFSLSIGILVSVFFYLIVVWYPNRQRKILIKRNFEQQYSMFKQDMISILLSAGRFNSDEDLITKLLDVKEFWEYFKYDSNKYSRWDDVLNVIDHPDEYGEFYLKELLVELEIFMNEIAYVLNNIEITDSEVFDFFKKLCQTVYRLKYIDTKSGFEEYKRLSNFIFEVFAGHSFATGPGNRDFIKDMIDKI
ncbi:MAG: hypothetical protein JXK07_01035 [Spirochaetes bacterium]|nr:hypothetical protein [Spirochaetota bacterium]